jgi:hypothetical protein
MGYAVPRHKPARGGSSGRSQGASGGFDEMSVACLGRWGAARPKFHLSNGAYKSLPLLPIGVRLYLTKVLARVVILFWHKSIIWLDTDKISHN